MNNLYIPFLITFLAGISTTIGYLFIYFKPKNINNFIGFFLAFSGSIMFFISLFELIPEGFFYLLKKYNLFVAVIVLLGMLLIGNIIIKIIDKFTSKNKPNNLEKIGILSMIGLMIHNMPEGILTFLSSSININLGIKLSVAIMLHNIPEGIAIAIPTYYGTNKKSRAFFYTLISGFAETIGAIVAYLFLYRFLSNLLISLILLFVSGIMVSISFNEIYREVEKYNKKYIILGTLLGLFIVILTEFVL